MIKSVRLRCWRSHADTSLVFREGTNLLLGIMGAGKSSVMEAISFSLFGTFPAIERRKLKLENVVRHSEPLAAVSLEFEWDGAPYRIERTIERTKKGTSTSAEIYRGSSLVEHGPVAVTSYVSMLTGMDYDLFTRAVYSEQNGIDHFLTLDPRKRKEEMDALLGLDRFETARSNAITVINRIRGERQALEGQFSREKLQALEMEEKNRTVEAGAAEASLKKAQETLEKGMRESSEAVASYASLSKAREEYERLSKEAIRLQALQEALAKALIGKTADPQSIIAADGRMKALSAERASLMEAQKNLDTKLASLSKESGSLEAMLRQAQESGKQFALAEEERKALLGGSTPEALAESQKQAEQALLQCESERKAVEREMQDIADSVSKLRPGMSECPLCLSKLSDDGIMHVKAEKERLIAQKKAKLAELSARIPQARKDAGDMLARIRKLSLIDERAKHLSKGMAAHDNLAVRKKELESELAAASSNRKELLAKAEPLSSSTEKLRFEIADMKATLAKKAEADDAARRLKEAQAALSGLKYDEKAYEASRVAAERAKLENERAQSAIRESRAALKQSADMLNRVRSELESLRGMGKAIAADIALEEQLSIYKNALLDAQLSLRGSLADAINAAMNEVWPVFYPYRNYRALRLGVSEKDYVFELDEGDGNWKPLETVASGGERACAALALRVAMAIVLAPKLGWLILDEPTHNLDSTAVALLSSALEQKVPQIVKQTFVITHDEAFMGSEFASSYRLVRDKDNNGESKLESA